MNNRNLSKNSTSKNNSTKNARAGASSQDTSSSTQFNSWFRLHQREAKHSLRHLTKKPFSFAITTTVLAIAITLPLLLFIAVKNLKVWASYSDTGLEVTLFLHENTEIEKAKSLSKDILNWHGVKQSEFVSSNDALTELSAHPELADIASNLPSNPLPNAIIITLSKEKNFSGNINDTASALSQRASDIPFVNEVKFNTEWFEKAEATVTVGNQITQYIATLLGLGLIALVANTIKVAIENRREEIIVCKLTGATDSFIRRPFLYMGLWIGLLSGILSLFFVNASLLALKSIVIPLSQAYSASISISGLSLAEILIVLAICCLLSLIGAWIICNQHLKTVEPN